jgi:signal transduction histidine kinase
MRRLSLRATLFIAILAVALVCVAASAILSNYISNHQIEQFVQQHSDELTGNSPTNPYPTGPQQPNLYPWLNLNPPPGQNPAPPPKPSNINLGFIIAGALGLVLALVLGFLLAARISEPLDGLTDATGKISGGDYSGRVKVKGGREVQELATAFNSLADSLEENEELRKNMVADVAHELRNPLATLRGQLELLQEGKIPYNQETVDSLMDDALLLSRIIDDLSQLTLVDAGKLEFVLQAVPPERLLGDVRARFEHEAAAKEIDLVVEDPGELPPVKADPSRLSQVLGNLVGNSLVHTPVEGKITLGAREAGGAVEFMVSDTGAGFTEEELPHVFDRFYRTDKSRSRATGGAGLGLSIARSLVEAQGGRIWARSEAGKGTTISFTVPIYQGNEGS